MPKYWGKNYFAHWSFPEVGQKQKTAFFISKGNFKTCSNSKKPGQSTHVSGQTAQKHR